MELCETPIGAAVEAAPFKTIQIHPTRKCNLSCIHCYSSSSPQMREMLDLTALKRFLSIAFEKGFNNISLSGGEPFLYRDLKDLLKFTRSIGYHNTVASNGMLLPSERNQRILEFIDLIAISIDGKPDLHNHIRNQKGAFDKMLKGVAVLQSHNKAFGFIHTITQQSWNDLIWLGEFAYNQNAKLLQLHPIEMYGRAIEHKNACEKDDMLLHRAYILANYLISKYANKMIIQADLLHRDYLKTFPQIVNPYSRKCACSGRFADIVDTIIVEENGNIFPLAYGFNKHFVIGNVYQTDPAIFENFIERKSDQLQQVIAHALEKVLTDVNTDIISWNELLITQSFLYKSKEIA